MQPEQQILEILKRYEMHEPVSAEEKATLHRWIGQGVQDIRLKAPPARSTPPARDTRKKRSAHIRLGLALVLLVILILAVMFV